MGSIKEGLLLLDPLLAMAQNCRDRFPMKAVCEAVLRWMRGGRLRTWV